MIGWLSSVSRAFTPVLRQNRVQGRCELCLLETPTCATVPVPPVPTVPGCPPAEERKGRKARLTEERNPNILEGNRPTPFTFSLPLSLSPPPPHLSLSSPSLSRIASHRKYRHSRLFFCWTTRPGNARFRLNQLTLLLLLQSTIRDAQRITAPASPQATRWVLATTTIHQGVLGKGEPETFRIC
ncbi:hypothetical protein DL95DRAFT_155495 [Leptodontidium sp. 2 PMI_412]|nr:hypothetical protein DL95DRAFT_155495 [Leptodontidium sp. 2 PMI_412]